MENGVTDRLWDKDVQEFIDACKHEKLSSVVLGYSEMDDGRKILNVTALYRTRSLGLILVGYRWVVHPERGWLPEFFVGNQTVPAAQQGAAVFGIAWRTGLRRERRHLRSALLTVREIFFKAQMVRAALDVEHLKALTNEEEVSVARAQELTLQTLNDLAYLYSAH